MMQKLEQLRKQIESIDRAIIEKLAERKTLSQQIGQLKMAMGKAVLDVSREKQLLAFYQELSKEHQLDPIFIEHLFGIILSYSRSLQ